MSDTTWSLSSCSVRPSVASSVSSTSDRSSTAARRDRRRAISSSRRASNARRDARAAFACAPRQRVRELPEHRPVDVRARRAEPVADVVGPGGELVAEEHPHDDAADGRLHAWREVEPLADREVVDHRGRAHRRSASARPGACAARTRAARATAVGRGRRRRSRASTSGRRTRRGAA